LIYAAAAYTFYCVAVSIVSAVRYRKADNPVILAVKAVNLAKALVALFALQTAMFASFGGGEGFQRIMNIIFGGGVCLAVFAMAIIMVVRANEKLKQIADGRL
jgi:predicted Co/Zn/Cd cation transporter (cation efflux family)